LRRIDLPAADYFFVSLAIAGGEMFGTPSTRMALGRIPVDDFTSP